MKKKQPVYNVKSMINKIKYICIILMILSCQSVEREKVEQKWISGLEIDLEKKHFVPNIILELNKGEGVIAEVGGENDVFEYKLRGNKIILKKTQKIFAEILSYSEDKLKLNFIGLDTLDLMKIEVRDSDIVQLKEILINHSLKLINQNSSSNRLAHFTDDEMLLLSEDIQRKEKKTPSLTFRRMKYSLDTISGLTILRVGGMTKELGYPLIGIMELVKDYISIRTFTEKGIYKSRLDHNKSRFEDNVKILLKKKWRLWGGKKLETFEFLENGQINHEKAGVKSILNWSIDESGYLLTFEDGKGIKNYGVINFEKNDYRIGYEFLPGKFSDLLNIKI